MCLCACLSRICDAMMMQKPELVFVRVHNMSGFRVMPGYTHMSACAIKFIEMKSAGAKQSSPFRLITVVFRDFAELDIIVEELIGHTFDILDGRRRANVLHERVPCRVKRRVLRSTPDKVCVEEVFD